MINKNTMLNFYQKHIRPTKNVFVFTVLAALLVGTTTTLLVAYEIVSINALLFLLATSAVMISWAFKKIANLMPPHTIINWDDSIKRTKREVDLTQEESVAEHDLAFRWWLFGHNFLWIAGGSLIAFICLAIWGFSGWVLSLLAGVLSYATYLVSGVVLRLPSSPKPGKLARGWLSAMPNGIYSWFDRANATVFMRYRIEAIDNHANNDIERLVNHCFTFYHKPTDRIVRRQRFTYCVSFKDEVINRIYALSPIFITAVFLYALLIAAGVGQPQQNGGWTAYGNTHPIIADLLPENLQQIDESAGTSPQNSNQTDEEQDINDDNSSTGGANNEDSQDGDGTSSSTDTEGNDSEQNGEGNTETSAAGSGDGGNESENTGNDGNTSTNSGAGAGESSEDDTGVQDEGNAESGQGDSSGQSELTGDTGQTSETTGDQEDSGNESAQSGDGQEGAADGQEDSGGEPTEPANGSEEAAGGEAEETRPQPGEGGAQTDSESGDGDADTGQDDETSGDGDTSEEESGNSGADSQSGDGAEASETAGQEDGDSDERGEQTGAGESGDATGATESGDVPEGDATNPTEAPPANGETVSLPSGLESAIIELEIPAMQPALASSTADDDTPEGGTPPPVKNIPGEQPNGVNFPRQQEQAIPNWMWEFYYNLYILFQSN